MPVKQSRLKHALSYSQRPGSGFLVTIRTINYINKINVPLGNYKEPNRKCTYLMFPNEEK